MPACSSGAPVVQMNPADYNERLVVVSGCSSGGKSTLLAELDRLGYRTVMEPGRQIVKEQLETGGDALPWANAARFVDLCIARGAASYAAASTLGQTVLFDRSVVDAISAARSMRGELSADHQSVLSQCRYAKRVFMVPPWRELFANDAERRHGFEEAVNEYDRLLHDYREWGYDVEILPPLPLAQRAGHLMGRLSQA